MFSKNKEIEELREKLGFSNAETRAAHNDYGNKNFQYVKKCHDFDQLKSSKDSIESELAKLAKENRELKFQLKPLRLKTFLVLYRDGEEQEIKANEHRKSPALTGRDDEVYHFYKYSAVDEFEIVAEVRVHDVRSITVG